MDYLFTLFLIRLISAVWRLETSFVLEGFIIKRFRTKQEEESKSVEPGTSDTISFCVWPSWWPLTLHVTSHCSCLCRLNPVEASPDQRQDGVQQHPAQLLHHPLLHLHWGERRDEGAEEGGVYSVRTRPCSGVCSIVVHCCVFWLIQHQVCVSCRYYTGEGVSMFCK